MSTTSSLADSIRHLDEIEKHAEYILDEELDQETIQSALTSVFDALCGDYPGAVVVRHSCKVFEKLASIDGEENSLALSRAAREIFEQNGGNVAQLFAGSTSQKPQMGSLLSSSGGSTYIPLSGGYNQLIVPFKRTTQPPIADAVREYISKFHLETSPDDFSWDISHWESLRADASSGNATAVDTILRSVPIVPICQQTLMTWCHLQSRYHAQLVLILTKLPVNVCVYRNYAARP